MKSNLIHSMTRVTRFAVTLLSAALLTTSVGCGDHFNLDREDDPKHEGETKRSWLSFGRKETVSKPAFQKLEASFEDLKAQITSGRTSADKAADKAAERAALWQAVAALFIVLSGIALVGGTALGSRARREQQQQQQAAVNLDEARS